MTRVLTIIFLGLIGHATHAHDLRLAYFEISENDSGYSLVVRFDRHDLLKELGSFGYLDKAVDDYLRENFSLLFDGVIVSWVVEETEIDDLFIEVKCSLVTENKKVTKINVWNTCLINSVDKHSNIIVSKLYGKNRSFKLDINRNKTVITY